MIVKNRNDIQKMMNFLNKADIVGFDTETTALGYKELQMVGMSFYTEIDKEYNGYYVFVTDDNISFLRESVNKLFENTKIVAHNWAYDLKVIRKYDFLEPKDIEDTMVMAHLIDEKQSKKLKELAKNILKVKDVKSFKEVVKGNIKETDEKELAEYGIKDAEWTYKLFKIFNPLIDKERVRTTYEKVELPLIRTLVDMEINGILINIPYLNSMSKRLDIEIDRLERGVYNIAGDKFNLNSPKQVGEILYGKLKLPILAKTKTGAPSTGAAVLNRLAEEGFPIAKQIVKFKELSKLNNTYAKKLPTYVDSDNRIRTGFHSLITSTGRLSSSSPNLQNIPTDKYWKVRRAFVPKKGYDLITADYSQVELRIIAHISKDKKMTNMFLNGEDIHQQTADEMDISRKDAKSANFAYAYGGWGDYRDRYFEKFPTIRKWQIYQEKFITKYGFVRTITGRKRRIGSPKGLKWKEVSGIYRKAYNSTIQGSGADIVKLAMIRVNNAIKEFGGKLLLTVHDEVVVESPKENTEKLVEVIRKQMEGAVKISVPLSVDIVVSQTWQEGK